MRGRLAWIVFGIVASISVVVAALSAILGSGGSVDLFVIGMLAFAVVGAIIASRHPDNAIGWFMLGVGTASAHDGFLSVYAGYALRFHPGSLPRPDPALALDSPMWIPLIGIIGTFVLLLFPDGRLPSPGWKAWAWLCGLALVASFGVALIAPGTFSDLGYPGIHNPLGVEALRPLVNGPAGALVLMLTPVSIIGRAVSLVRRFRRSRGQARLQLKWLAAAGAVAVVYLAAMIPSVLLDLPWNGTGPVWLTGLQAAATYSFLLIPVAAGAAILEYRLYGIDVIINKTIVYACLTVVLAIVSVAGVVGGSTVVREVAGEGSKASSSRLRRSPWPRCSAPLGPASRASSIGASTAADTTRPRPCRVSRDTFATRLLSTR